MEDVEESSSDEQTATAPSSDARQVTFSKPVLDIFRCTLCNDYFKDVHTIKDCLHSYCQQCLVNFWLQKGSTHPDGSFRCPRAGCSAVLGATAPLELSCRRDITLQSLLSKLFPDSDSSAPSLSFPNSQLSLSSAGSPASAPIVAASPSAASPSLQRVLIPGAPTIVELRPEPNATPEFKLETLPQPFLSVGANFPIRLMKKFIIQSLQLGDNAAVDVLCNGDVIGNDHTLQFVKRTKYQNKESHLILTYCRHRPLKFFTS